MQNKPNYHSNKMNTTLLLTKHYENKTCPQTLKKQTQTNPILSASGGFKRDLAKMEYHE
jgi:hypothetical protein